MKFARILSLILAVLLLTCSFVACDVKDDGADDTNNGAKQPEAIVLDVVESSYTAYTIIRDYKASGTVPVDVYNWNGEKVGSFNITGFGMGEDVSYNVQSIFFHNGKMHATVCSWTTGYQAYFDWVVDIDQSILN
jgi:hypothetical protein